MKFARWFFYITFVIFLMTEAQPPSDDPLAGIGWFLHADLKSWLPVPLAFNPVEICLAVCVVLWLTRGAANRKSGAFDRGRLLPPLLAFAAACVVGVLWGMVRGGDSFTYALFEVRGFGVMICAYLLVGILLHEEGDLDKLVWCVLIACAGLALENTWRYFVILHGASTFSDLEYDHDDSLILGFGTLLCVALFAFGGSRRQRTFALFLLPLSLLCLEVMRRRVAFALVPVGFCILALIWYRLRPKQFWRIMPALALVAGVYLAVFWNNNGTLGQPARAIHSVISPDPRDAASNAYRDIERLDILANIATSRLLGIGFGQQYQFVYPLPTISGWPFWHYTSHNAVLWVWMDGGIPAFFAFFWLLGAGTFEGCQELAVRREAWSLAQIRLRRTKRARPRRGSNGMDVGEEAPSDLASVREAVRSRAPSGPRSGGLTARRHTARPAKRSLAASGSVAFVAAGACLGAMQITYSYVDLGLANDPRTMLLLGVVLGVVGRAFLSRGSEQPAKRKKRPLAAARAVRVAPVYAATRSTQTRAELEGAFSERTHTAPVEAWAESLESLASGSGARDAHAT